MRTTLTIDDDVLATARHHAQREHKSVGEVISALARQALLMQKAQGGLAAPARSRNGIPLLAVPAGKDAAVVTPELVNQLRDELP
ncbi:ribbon-helix-helix protein, CopG family [Acidovorax sp. YS12]|nr:ribbon-helix-helix protein, CopG family [Acidovorax sp. YS12]